MTNADRIKNLSDEELAETYINVLDLNSPVVHGEAYQSKHTGMIYYKKEDAIKNELEWLRKDVPKITNAEKIRNMDNEELAEFLQSIKVKGYIDKSITTKIGDDYLAGIRLWLKSEVEE